MVAATARQRQLTNPEIEFGIADTCPIFQALFLLVLLGKYQQFARLISPILRYGALRLLSGKGTRIAGGTLSAATG
jgi:hypothetical protein